MKSVATRIAAVGAIGAAAFGVTPIAFASAQPQDPPPPFPAQGVNLPSAEQLSGLLTKATDPGVSYTTKFGLVENGISSGEGHAADHDLRKAFRDGKFPQTYTVTNIQPAGPNGATADVAITGPKFAGPVTKHLAFVNQGGNWVVQHASALALIQAATG